MPTIRESLTGVGPLHQESQPSLAAFASMLPALAALLITRRPGIGLNAISVFTIVFLFQGLQTTASVLGTGNYLLEVSTSIERVLYIGLTYGIVGLTWYALALGGIVVDSFGFEVMFSISLLAGLIATIISLRLEEPRKRNTPVLR